MMGKADRSTSSNMFEEDDEDEEDAMTMRYGEYSKKRRE